MIDVALTVNRAPSGKVANTSSTPRRTSSWPTLTVLARLPREWYITKRPAPAGLLSGLRGVGLRLRHREFCPQPDDRPLVRHYALPFAIGAATRTNGAFSRAAARSRTTGPGRCRTAPRWRR